MSISGEPQKPLTSEGEVGRSINSGNGKLLRSANAEEDLEGVASQRAVFRA